MNSRTLRQKLEMLNNVYRRFRHDETTQYNFANISSPFHTRPNHHPQKIEVRETFSVPMIYQTHRHQHHTITPPPYISTVANGLQNLTLHPHPARNEWVTGCLVCGKSYDQVIEETVSVYLNLIAQPGETKRERQIKRNAFIDGIQSGVFTFQPCDDMTSVEGTTRLVNEREVRSRKK